MKKKFLLFLFILFISCTSFSENSEDSFTSKDYIEESAYPVTQGIADRASNQVEGSYSSGDYVIKTAYASTDVSSSDFDKTVTQVKEIVKKYEGNISNTYLSTNYQGLKSYSLTSNIPSEDFDTFLVEIEKLSKFTNINLNANDVTVYVLDIDSRIKSLNEEKLALEAIREEATTTEDKLQVQSQLRYINQEIEILQNQKEYYERTTSYSSLTLEIREGAGVSLFSWNYYVQRALTWVEEIVGFSVSVSIIIVPLLIIYIGFKKIRKKD